MKKAFWILVLLLAMSVVVNVWQCSHEPDIETKIERDTVWKDSIIREPLPAETINTGRVVYIRVPIPQGDGSSAPTQEPSPEDSIEVPIPIVQKRYDDSLYTAWVSGFEPKLDSIDLRLPTIYETITKTITKPSPLVNFGIQVGGGYGVIHRQPDFYIGVGAQLNLWKR